MAARGNLSKEKIKSTILEVFPGSFLYNDGKEIRIPMTEEGELIQIKCTLTAAKVNVENGADSTIPGEVIKSTVESFTSEEKQTSISSDTVSEPTEEEKATVEALLHKLGIA